MRSLPHLGAVVLLAAPAGAWALGLGDIQLHSALNQPFEAEIPLLSATPDELQSVKVGLASRETFDRYGLDRPSDLSALSFKVTKNAAGRDVILVTSTQRIDDPFVTMLVEVSSRTGRLLHEYTVLLDPPVLLQGPAEQAPIRQARSASPQTGGAIARAPASEAAPARPAAAPQTAASSSGSAAAPGAGSGQARSAASSPSGGNAATAATASSPAAVAPGGTYGPVQRDETLWGIASSLRPAGVTTNQMMVALYQANPDAFDKNMNLLRRGASLRVPEQSELLSMTPVAATAEVRQQSASWQNRGQAAQAGEAQPTGQTEQARLRLVPPPQGGAGAGAGAAAGEGAGASAGGSGAGAAGGSGGDAGAASAEVANLREQVQSLRSQLDDNKRMLELKDQQLATLQEQMKQASAGGAATPPAEAAKTAAAATAPGVALESEQLFTDDAGAKKAAGAAGSAAGAGQNPAATEAGAENAATPPAQAEATPPPAAQPKPAAPTPAKSPAVATSVPAAPAPSLLSRVLGWVANPVLLIGLGIAAVLLTAVWYLRHRREEADDVTGRWDALEAEIEEETRVATARVRRPEDASMIVEEQGRRAQSAAGDDEDFEPAPAATGRHRQSSDETLSSQTVINLDQADPVAEADFHMAYGLYDQAAELVTKALEAEPKRRDLKLKLLEVYFVWGNKEAFLDAARDLRAEIGDMADADWDKVLIMGKQICPEEPMFAESAAGAGSVDVDLQGGGSTELDFAFDDKGSDGGVDLFGEESGGDGLDFELAGTGERLAAGEDDAHAHAHDADDEEQDFGESLDIGAQTAAGLEAALFMGEDADAETGSATKPDLEYDSLAATQESATAENRSEQDDWTSLLDEASEDEDEEDSDRAPTVETPTVETTYASDAPTMETPTIETAGPDVPTVETPTVETAYASDAPTMETPTIETAGPDAPTMETPTLETAYAGADELPGSERTDIGPGPSDHTEEIDLDDLGLSVGDLEDLPDDIGDLPRADDGESDTREQPVLSGDDALLSATGVTEVLLEHDLEGDDVAIELEGESSADAEDDDLGYTDRARRADDGVAAGARNGADAADLEQMETSVLSDYDATVMSPSFDDGTFVGTEVLEQRRETDQSGDTSLMKSLAGFGGGESADDGGLDLNLEDLSSALEGGDTVEQPRTSGFGEFFEGGETPLDLDVGADVSGADDPTGTEHMGPLDPQTMTEIGTKLDLARAYIDMGDPEGARSILEEVLDEGDSTQRREAQGLIDALSA